MEHVGSSQNKTLQEDGNLQAGNGLQAQLKLDCSGHSKPKLRAACSRGAQSGALAPWVYYLLTHKLVILGLLLPDEATGQAKSPRGSMTQPAQQGA